MSRQAAIPIWLFLGVRLLLTAWAAAILFVLPAEATVLPEATSPVGYWLLAPWQRFDTNHYLQLAQEGYSEVQSSVFPPLYPLVVRGVGWVLGGRYLLAALLVSNGALLGLLLVMRRLAEPMIGGRAATYALVYLLLFPTGFFWFAGYTESLFGLLAVGSLWLGRNGRFFYACVLAFLAALTRINGWLLLFPLAVLVWEQGKWDGKTAVWLLLPPFAPALFLAYRHWLGLPPLAEVYAVHWYQQMGVPGQDVVTAVRLLLFGGDVAASRFVIAFDLLIVVGLAAGTVLVWRRFGAVYGVYMGVMLVFILLPTSDVKPLFSFSRYALAFFPLFWLLGAWGEERPFVHRLILYPSLILLLYFSGQFFLGGWVA